MNRHFQASWVSQPAMKFHRVRVYFRNWQIVLNHQVFLSLWCEYSSCYIQGWKWDDVPYHHFLGQLETILPVLFGGMPHRCVTGPIPVTVHIWYLKHSALVLWRATWFSTRHICAGCMNNWNHLSAELLDTLRELTAFPRYHRWIVGGDPGEGKGYKGKRDMKWKWGRRSRERGKRRKGRERAYWHFCNFVSNLGCILLG